MRRFVVLGLLVVVALVAASAASASGWQPGTWAFVSKGEMEGLLQGKADFATCRGIQRYGVRGSTYHRFDCTLEGVPGLGTCYGVQVAAVKATRRGFFSPKIVKLDACY